MRNTYWALLFAHASIFDIFALMVQVIYEYVVKPGQTAEFEKIFDKNGEWIRFFRESRAYKGTELIIKNKESRIYVTIDKWKGPEAYEQFIKNNIKGFKRLFNSCKGFTESVTESGIFSES